MSLFEPLFEAIDAAGVRFVVVGGVATVLHGHVRFTADLDIAVDLDSDDPAALIEALVERGLTPLLPVDAREFSDPEVRRGWVEERNLRVFSLFSPDDPLLRVDVFAANPIPFSDLWDRSVSVGLSTTTVRIAGLDDLIAMKRDAGRAQDLADIEALEAIRDRRGEP